MLLKVPVEAKQALDSLVATVYKLVQTEVQQGRCRLLLPAKVGDPIQKILYEESSEIPFLANYYNLLCITSKKLWDKIDGNLTVLLTVKGLLPDVGTVIDGLNLAKKYGLLDIKGNNPLNLLLKDYKEDLEFAQLKLLFDFCAKCKSLPSGLVRPLNSLFKDYENDYRFAELKTSLAELYQKHGLLPSDFGKKEEEEKEAIIERLLGSDTTLLDKIKHVYFHKIKPDLQALIADKKSGHFAWELYEQLFPITEFFLNNFGKIFFQHEKLLMVRPEYYMVLRETIGTLKTILQAIGKADLGKHTRGNIDYIIDWALYFGEKFGATPPAVTRYNTMLSIEAPDKSKLDERFLSRGAGNELMDFVVDVSPLEKPFIIKFRKPKVLETYQLLTYLSEQKGIPKDVHLYLRAFLVGLIVKECPLYLQLDSFEYFYSYYVNKKGQTQLESVLPAIEFTEEFTPVINEVALWKPNKPDIFVEVSDNKIIDLSRHYGFWIVQVPNIPNKQALDNELTSYQRIVEQRRNVLERFYWLTFLGKQKQGYEKTPQEIFFYIRQYLFDITVGEYHQLKKSESNFYYANRERQPRLLKHKNSLWIYQNSYVNTTLELLNNPSFSIEFPEKPTQRQICFSNDKASYEKKYTAFNSKHEIINKHKVDGLSKLWCAHNDVFKVADAAITFPLDLISNDGYRLGLKGNKYPDTLEFLISQPEPCEGIEGVVYVLRTAHKEVKEGVISYKQLEATLGDRYKTFVIALEKKDLPTLQTFLRDLLNIVGQDVAPTIFKPYVMNSLVTVPAPVNQHLEFWQDLNDSILTIAAENKKFAQYLDSISITAMNDFLTAKTTDSVILTGLKISYEREIKIQAEMNKRAVELDGVRKKMALVEKLENAPKVSFFDPLVTFESLVLVEESKPRNHVTKETFEPVLKKLQTQNSEVYERMTLKRNALEEVKDFLALSISMEEAYVAVLEKQESVAGIVMAGDIGFDRNACLNFAVQLSQMMAQGFDWSEVERQKFQFKQFFPQLRQWYAVRWQNDLKPLHDKLIQQIFQHDVKKLTNDLTIDREKSLNTFVEQLTKLTAAIDDANEEELSRIEEAFKKIAERKNIFDTKLCLQEIYKKILSLLNDLHYQALAKAYFTSPSSLSDLASIQALSESFYAQIKSIEAILKNRREALLLESGNAVQKLEMEVETHKQQVEKDKVVLQEISELDHKYQAVYQEKIKELKQNEREIFSVSAKKSSVIKPDKKAYAVDLAGIYKEMTLTTDPGCLQVQEELKVLMEVIQCFESQSARLTNEKNVVQCVLIEKELSEKIADNENQINAIGVYEGALSSIIASPRDEKIITEALIQITNNKEILNQALKYKNVLVHISDYIEKFKNDRWYWERNFKADLEKFSAYANSRKIEILSLKVTNQKQHKQVAGDLETLKLQFNSSSPNAQEFSADAAVLKNQLDVAEKSLNLVKQQLDNSIKRRTELESAHTKLTDHNQQLQKLFDAREQSEKSLNDFSSVHKNQLQEKYNTLSSPVTLTSDKIDVSAQKIAYSEEKNKQLAHLEYRLVLCQMKQDFIAKEEALRVLEKLIDTFEIPDLIYHKNENRADSPLSYRWSLHEKNCKKELKTAEDSLTNYCDSLSTLGDELNVLQRAQQKLETDERRPLEDKNSLLLLKKNAEMLQRLLELKESVTKKHLTRQMSLETESKRFIVEDENWRTYERHLDDAQKFLENINNQIELLEARPINIVQQVVNATCPEDAILVEDNHFANLFDAIQLYREEEKKIQLCIVDKSELSALEIEFNEELNQLLATIKKRLTELETQYEAKKAAWDQLFNANPVMLNSRELLMSNDHKKRDYRYYDLRGIRLSDRDFSTARMRNAKFNSAKLTNCTFASRLDDVDFRNADISTCTFDDNASFQGVIINDGTNIGVYGPKILRDNFVYPDYHNTSEYYATLLQCITPTGDDVLNILKGIATARVCQNKSPEQQLMARKARAVMVIELMLPKLQSIEEVIKLKALIDTKHLEANNPFAYIRQERDWLKNMFGLKYGNTGTWQKISEKIKNHLFNLSQQRAANSLSLQNYQNVEKMMETHTKHDYGFGFFYTPTEAKQWEQEKARLVAAPVNAS